MEIERLSEKNHQNITFHDSSYSDSQIVPCGWTDGRKDRETDRRTDITNLIVALRNFENEPKNQHLERNRCSVGIRTTSSTITEHLPATHAAAQRSAMEQ